MSSNPLTQIFAYYFTQNKIASKTYLATARRYWWELLVGATDGRSHKWWREKMGAANGGSCRRWGKKIIVRVSDKNSFGIKICWMVSDEKNGL